MAEKIFRKPKAVLIFNRRKTLALMAASVNEAAKISGLKPGNISKACGGLLELDFSLGTSLSGILQWIS